MTTAQGEPAASTPVIPTWTLADRLRKVRREVARVEQIEMAGLLEVGAPTYAAWESGRTTPRNQVTVAKRVELATGVPASWMLGLDDPMPPAPRDRPSTGELRSSSSRGKVGPAVGVVIRPRFNGSRTDTERIAPAAIRDGEAA